MTITGATVSWVNDDAYLRSVVIRGGRSSGATISNAVPASRAAAAAPQSYTTTVTLGAPVTIAALDRYVPITFEFKDSAANPVNMRGDEIKVSLTVTNDSTLTATCGSFLTVSEAEESVNVPGGPSVTSTQQNKPLSGTNSYAVPGSTGLNTVPAVLMTTEGPVADGGLVVSGFRGYREQYVSEDTLSKISISSGKLYYAVTSYATHRASGNHRVLYRGFDDPERPLDAVFRLYVHDALLRGYSGAERTKGMVFYQGD